MSKLLPENPQLEKFLLEKILSNKLQDSKEIHSNIFLHLICCIDDLVDKGLVEQYQDALTTALPKEFPPNYLYRLKQK